jgi:uncharacterized membrane protein YedE/YeeE
MRFTRMVETRPRRPGQDRMPVSLRGVPVVNPHGPSIQPTPRGWLISAVAGVLVGFGSQLGNGCTSGHGMCGIGKLSKRSIVSTMTFVATGALTVFVTSHLFGGGR